MKTSKKSRIISLIIILIIVVIIISKNKTFIPENQIINHKNYEILRNAELTSCQKDCSLGKGDFHEECIGFNGCENSPFLRNRDYCEKDSDCVVDFGCCTYSCEKASCLNFCAVSNRVFVEAHSFSCENNIICTKKEQCFDEFKIKCFNNKCRILS
ncbi:hypothetical protein ACFLTH_11210 [Bacteroidota bacterium]